MTAWKLSDATQASDSLYIYFKLISDKPFIPFMSSYDLYSTHDLQCMKPCFKINQVCSPHSSDLKKIYFPWESTREFFSYYARCNYLPLGISAFVIQNREDTHIKQEIHPDDIPQGQF